MEFTTGTTAGLFVAIVALGVGGLIAAPIPMAPSTIMMMVLPSMAVFGLITLAIGVKHGAYRANN